MFFFIKEGMMTAPSKKPFYRTLYVQVLFAVALGALLGCMRPDLAVEMKPFGDGFIKLMKMLVPAVVFLTVAHGVGSMADMRKAGRVGVKALVYFEIVSTLALVLGLTVANVVKPGAGVLADPKELDAEAVASYAEKAEKLSVVDHLLGIVPDTLLSAFVEGEMLQVLLVAVLFGSALVRIGDRGQAILRLLDDLMAAMFKAVHIVTYLAPLGAFGAMAFTIGKYGAGTLGSLLLLIGTFYMTALLFVVLVLGGIARASGFSLFALIRYLKDEIWLVLGTSSSESALPLLIRKLEKAGCSESVVGLVVPMGYSFNLDGTNIYMTLAALFVAQATGVDLSLGQQLVLLSVALLSSKGAAGVTGSGFVVLASTLSAVPEIPVAGLALILGVDRFMSECRAVTNFIGNAVAAVVVSRWEGESDKEASEKAFGGILFEKV